MRKFLPYVATLFLLLVVAVPVVATTASPYNDRPISLSSPMGGGSPSMARLLVEGVNQGSVTPGDDVWYVYSTPGSEAKPVVMSMVYRPATGDTVSYVNFHVFNPGQLDSWLRGTATEVEELWMGMPVSADYDEDTLERVWAGALPGNGQYYVHVFNNSEAQVDYRLSLVSGADEAAMPIQPPSGGEILPEKEMSEAEKARWLLAAQAVEGLETEEGVEWMMRAQAVGWLRAENLIEPTEGAPAAEATKWMLAVQAIESLPAEEGARWLAMANELNWLPYMPQSSLPAPLGILGEYGEYAETETAADEQPALANYVNVPESTAELAPVSVYPNDPLVLKEGVNTGRIPPFGEHWYALTPGGIKDRDQTVDAALTLIHTPSDGNTVHKVYMDIYPYSEYHVWARGDSDEMRGFGKGQVVSRDGDPNTGEHIWSGTLVGGNEYLVKIYNGTFEPIDYYLFPADITNAELGGPINMLRDRERPYVPEVAGPLAPIEPGTAMNYPLTLNLGSNKGALQVGEKRWYRFIFPNYETDTNHNRHFVFLLTMTPLDTIRARHAKVYIYPASQLHIWLRGDEDELEPLGVSGKSPFKPKNPVDLQELWDGHLMENLEYYVLVKNVDIGPLGYNLEVYLK